MPDDFFRIRLIATILETCGIFFNRGAAGKKLDYFLSFLQVSFLYVKSCKLFLTKLQYYIHTKQSLPMDIEFIVQDTYLLTRPQWKLATNLEEATKAFQLAIAQDNKNSGVEKAPDTDDISVHSSSDDDGVEGEGEVVDAEADSDRDSELGDDEDAGADDEDGDVSSICSCSWLFALTQISRMWMKSTIIPNPVKVRIRKKSRS
jgi:regulator of nonsense transcripts 2